MADFPATQSHGFTSAGCLATLGAGPMSDYLNIVRVAGTAGVWSVANKAHYMPVTVYETVTVYQMGWENGGTASGNIDVGIFGPWPSWTKLVSSGSTAQAGTSTIQLVNTADVTLAPGIYFIGMSMDNTTGTVMRTSQNQQATIPYGVLEETSALPLPSTATPVSPVSAMQPFVYALIAAT